MKLNISNLLTLARVIVIPIIVLCIYMKSPFYGWVAFVLFCIASITDYFDGYIARIRTSSKGYGKTIYLQLHDGNTAVYAHLDHFTPKVDNLVNKSERPGLKKVQWDGTNSVGKPVSPAP